MSWWGRRRTKKTRRAGWVLGCLLFVVGGLRAQRFTFTAYGAQSGLSNLNVSALLEDHTGVVWAATQNGTFVADGDRFEKHSKLADSGFEDIRALREDDDGRIWIADGRRLGFWQNGQTQSIDGVKMHILSHEVIDLIVLPGQHDSVYLLRAGELLKVFTGDLGKTWQTVPALSPHLLASVSDLSSITSATQAGPSKMWLGCGTSLCLVDLESQSASEYGETAGVPKDQWSAVHVTHAGEIWARGDKNVVVAKRNTTTFEEVGGLPKDTFRSLRHKVLAEDSAGRLILNLTQGIAIGSRTGWQVFREVNGLPEEEIDTVLQDHAGSLWLTSLGHGVFRWRGYGVWEGWTKNNGLQSDIVWSIARDAHQDLWIASNAGLDKLDLATQRISQQGYSGQRLLSVVVDQRQHLWLDDSTGQIIDKNLASGDTRVAATGLDRVFQMHVDQKDRVWACTRRGLVYFSPRDKWKNPHRVNLPGAPSGYAWSISEAADGTLWVNADKGIYRLKGEQWTNIDLPFDEANQENRMIAAAPDGTLWVQNSLPYPILHLAIKGNFAKVIGRVDTKQIASDNTTFLELDHRGWVWVGSDDGVHVFNGKEWAQCTEEDGLLWNDTDFHAFASDPDGSVWIGTSAGVSHVIHPEHIFTPFSPQVQVLDLDLSGKQMPQNGSVFDLRKPTLSFRFRNRNYDRGSAVVAQYRLDGEEVEWHDTSGTTIRFPALEPGEYNLRVRAFDQRLGRTSAESQVHFRLLAPWWKRGWFVVIEAIAVLLFFLGIWRLSVSLLVARQRQLARLVALRTSELESRTDELESEKKELLVARSALLEIARQDGLTGLLNRRAILDQLESLCQMKPPKVMPLSIIMADLDSFKKINDTYGHLAGDAVLRECADRIRNNIRERDLVGRYGGEELLIILVGLPPELAMPRIEMLRAAIASAPISHDDEQLHVTCSFGVAWFHGDESTVENLLNLADVALYRAKRNGRDRVEYDFSESQLYLEAHTSVVQ